MNLVNDHQISGPLPEEEVLNFKKRIHDLKNEISALGPGIPRDAKESKLHSLLQDTQMLIGECMSKQQYQQATIADNAEDNIFQAGNLGIEAPTTISNFADGDVAAHNIGFSDDQNDQVFELRGFRCFFFGVKIMQQRERQK